MTVHKAYTVHNMYTVVKCVFSGTTFKLNFIFSFFRGGLQVGITTAGSDPTCSPLFAFSRWTFRYDGNPDVSYNQDLFKTFFKEKG